jgi:hypothetical protein
MATPTVAVPENDEDHPMTYVVTKWWAYVFCTMYLLYGGVKVILGFLDHNYTDLNAPLVALVIGLALAVVATGYRDRRSWAWYGLVALNVVVILLAVLKLSFVGNIVLLILSLVMLGALFAPATKSYIFGRR